MTQKAHKLVKVSWYTCNLCWNDCWLIGLLIPVISSCVLYFCCYHTSYIVYTLCSYLFFRHPRVCDDTLFYLRRIFGAPLGGNRQGVAFARTDDDRSTPSSASEKEAKLHALVERGDAKGVEEFLRNEQQQEVATGNGKKETPEPREETTALAAAAAEAGGSNVVVVDASCPRTGLTPLLKAVEGSSESVVRVLLEAGADVRRQVRNTSLELSYHMVSRSFLCFPFLHNLISLYLCPFYGNNSSKRSRRVILCHRQKPNICGSSGGVILALREAARGRGIAAAPV